MTPLTFSQNTSSGLFPKRTSTPFKCAATTHRTSSFYASEQHTFVSYVYFSQPRLYSDLSATIGSTFVARRAGTKQATSATAVRKAATAAYVSGSMGEMP